MAGDRPAIFHEMAAIGRKLAPKTISFHVILECILTARLGNIKGDFRVRNNRVDEKVLGGREKLKKKLKFVFSFVIFLDLLINKNVVKRYN